MTQVRHAHFSFRKFIHSVVILSLLLNSAVIHIGSLHSTANAAPTQKMTPREATITAHSLLQDPLIAEFEKADQIPLKLGLPANDPTLDRDPFFLSSQSWGDIAPEKLTGQISAIADDSGLKILVPMAKSILNISKPLDLIAITDEFIFLSAQRNFQEFDQKSGDLGVVAEGIFIISKSDLLSHSYQRLPVPIYFLPLPDSGWKETTGVYSPESDMLILIDNQEEALPIPLSEIKEVLKIEKFNLLLAQGFSFASHPDERISDLRRVIPTPRITAGFGTLFTGFNDSDITHSLFAASGGLGVKDRLTSFFNTFKNEIGFSEAQASGFHLDPHLALRLIRVAEVVGVAVVASVVLKLSVYRQYKKSSEPQANEKEGRLRRAAHEIKQTGDIFAHTLTTFSQFASVWFGNTVEFLGDRYFPQLASANNTMVRKFLNKTVLWVRDTNDRVPVSGRTWLFGSPLLGGIDTFFVAVQLYAVVPFIGQEIGSHLPMLQSRVDDAFAIGNPNIASINQNETIRNAAAYITSGASSFSQDLQAQLDEKVKNEIKDQMRREQKDPEIAANSAKFKRLYDDRLNMEMQKLGVPNKDDFLFDANSLYMDAIKLLGYNLPTEALIGGVKPETIAGLTRPGLVIGSIREAINRLKNGQSMYSLDQGMVHRQEALDILVKYSRDLNVLKSFVTAPVRALLPSDGSQINVASRFTELVKRARSTRQAFMLLTYEGDFENIKSYIPAEWQKYNPEALRLAAKTFSDVFSNYINGEQKELVFAPPARDRVTERQERKAISVAAERFLSVKGYAFNTIVASEQDSAFFKELYAEELNRNLGLHPYYGEKPEMENTVKERTLQYTANELSKPEVKAYLEALEPEKRFRFECAIHASNAVKAYKEVVVSSGDYSAISPSQPGRLQRRRQKETVRNSKVLTRLVRALEALVAGDEIKTGRTALLDRNIPMWYDFKKSNKRVYAGAITRATASYAFNYIVWGMNLPAHLWTLSLVSAFTIGAPAQFLTRFFNYQGAKPMGKVSMMTLFAVIYTWSTFWGEIPQQIFASDFQRAFHFVVGQHLPESIVISSAIVALVKYKDTIKEKVVEFATEKKVLLEKAVNACSTFF